MTSPPHHADPVGRPAPWRDASLPVAQRVGELLARMTLREKAAQLYGVWVGADDSGEGVAPHQHDMTVEPPDLDALVEHGLGQLTRPFGTTPVDPAMGALALARSQERITAANRFAIPAIAHEECLAGFTAWTATIYPVPLAWGATFDPDLVERMAAQIGASMRSVGVHQGLAPVLDVTRDPRWGRTEETMGEDPYLVATLGTAYVRGLQSAGVVATLKHFVGYSASRGARNLAPASVGPRETADVLLPPFEMAVRHGGVRSVMHSYADVDGVPAAADRSLLTGLLRERWGFTGTVVADYFGIAFLRTLHGVAGTDADAAALALQAGVDVELPTVHCFGPPLLEAVRTGLLPEAAVDTAVRRVLTQKCELGLLDEDWTPLPAAVSAGERGSIDLDPPENRALARRVAEESVVLLANDAAVLPLGATARIAVVGPLADDPNAMLGCYSFPAHVGTHHPEVPLGVEVPTVLAALRRELPRAEITHAAGCAVTGDDETGFAAALHAAEEADVCVLVLGDRAGLFGRGTSGEGCDATDLTLPGSQERLAHALAATGTPVVLVLLTGRPYALGGLAPRVAAQVQMFFPGEEGGPALAGVLGGRVAPSGRLPVSVPRGPGGQPWTYLAAPLGLRSEVSAVDPTPLHPFGHGLSYTRFEWTDLRLADEEASTDGELRLGCAVRNTGARAGTEVVQLYLGDPVARVARPLRKLIGYARVALEPGQERRVEFTVPADLAAYTGPEGRAIVEPGELVLELAASSSDIRHTVRPHLVGPVREVDHTRRLTAPVTVAPPRS
ncbi:glycoside hydrolase family 3 N-terminal domain-containing protein [Nocardiopsis ansamitocini]|uniref:Beta-glucosidase n=1 Tax=Nocardiopsis ansamitocini TaxID=1670832 RepID=A0A9W6P7S7_9ACTN|nr:glycoside hydrolase family 3 N-terminal domain-containing protein [Nocardiopsis ansamitocini]GLU48591.1 beta-glucosidase [Nocardiopsis ansamitocini]